MTMQTTTTNGRGKAPRPLYEMIPVGAIAESPTNPRKTFADVEELADDIKRRGVLQPILVRHGTKTPYELVFGARRLRAAKLAGLAEIPAAVREMTDAEVLETQIVENAKRADIHPLEEADGYRALHEQHGWTVEDLAAKLGKSTGYVYQRLKLCALWPEARQAFLEAKLTPATALLVARIPDPKLQADAVTDLTDERRPALRLAEAQEHIQRRFMLRLADAPFDRGDAALVPDAGACTTCPKRTGNQRELFADVKSKDVCTDLVCFNRKRDAVWKQKKEAAKASGQKVLEGKAAKDVFSYGSAVSYSFVDLDAERHDYGSNAKPKRWRELVGDKLAGEKAPKPILVRAPDGDIKEILPLKEAEKLLPKAKEKKEPTTSAADEQARADREKSRREAERRESQRRALTVACVTAAAKKEPTDALWRVLIASMGSRGAGFEVLERRGLGDDTTVDAVAAKLKAGELRAFALEIALEEDVGGTLIDEACAALRVDKAKVLAKRRCRRCGCTDDAACAGGCTWVGKDLCSSCKEKKR